ncbi:MAG: PAS domain S-box protein [bacterium]|nr:PAS domain S-box protein [bacterium]
MTYRDEAQVNLALTVERMALTMRYIVYLVLMPMYLLNYIHSTFSDLVVVTVIVGLHNAFAHWVLISGRHHVFASRLNFLIYFAETCLVVKFTGAESSYAFVLYLLVLVGYGAYTPRFFRTILVSLLFTASFLAMIFIEYLHAGISESMGLIGMKSMTILICGWLVGSLNEVLSDTQLQSRRQAEELAASEATLRTIFNSVVDPLLVCDDREFITDANEQACELLGVPRDRLLQQRFRKFLFDDGTLPQKIAALRARGAVHGEEIVVSADGEEHTVDYTARSFFRDNQRYYVTILHDMTDQKELQEATRQANMNLERLNSELRHVGEIKMKFWSRISLRLRSPLSAVLGHVEMLLGEELGEVAPDQRKSLHACRRATLRSLQLLDDAPTYARPEVNDGEAAVENGNGEELSADNGDR